MENETWKDIVGYDGIYKISDLGRAKLCRLSFLSESGYVATNEIILNPVHRSGGSKYIYYGLYNHKNGEYKLHSAHRLVAQAFIPNPENKPQVNHIEGNKLDNRACVLEWVTTSENQRHSIKSGLRKTGCARHNAKFTREQIIDIRRKYKPYVYTLESLSNEYSCSIRMIARIINNESYKDVPNHEGTISVNV